MEEKRKYSLCKLYNVGYETQDYSTFSICMSEKEPPTPEILVLTLLYYTRIV